MNKINRVLIIDDELEIREILGDIIESIDMAKNSFSISYAEDGEQAYIEIERNKYDLIFIDLNMPKVNGFEVLDEIRSSDSPNKHTPFVVVSANIRDLKLKDKDDTIEGVFFIDKPFDDSRIINLTKMLLSKAA